MIETVRNEFVLQGYEIGKAQGELQGKVKAILTILRVNFGRIPSAISEELNRRTDPIALESLLEIAAQCDSLAEFADALK